MSIVMTGGGTGGHLAIVRAVKEELIDKNIELVYIGSTRGQDKQWFEHDTEFNARYFLKSQGVVNKKGFAKILSLFDVFKSTLQARKLLKSHNAKAVLSVGGFSAAPTAFASLSLGIPLIIHEQNASMGTLNKLLKPYAKEFISSYEDTSKQIPYPINNIYFQTARVRDDIKTIIFLGGSQGAKAINELALRLAPTLKRQGISIVHQAGEKNIQEVQESYKKLDIDAEVFGFSDKLSEYIAKADFAIARAGASTLWELSANGLPTLYIPYPYAASDHQYYNAKFLVDQNLAWVMRENEINIDKIYNILSSDIKQVSKRLTTNTKNQGAKQISDILYDLC